MAHESNTGSGPGDGGVNARRLLDDPCQLGFVRRAAQVVEGLAGGEVHHQQPVPVVAVHVAARGVGVQPRVADARRRDDAR